MRPFHAVIGLVFSCVTLACTPSMACVAANPSDAAAMELARMWADERHVLVGRAIPLSAQGSADQIRETGCAGTEELGALVRILAEKVRQGSTAIILGEVHDNPTHHVARARLLQAIVEESGQAPGLVFEQFKRGQQPGIDAHLALPTSTPARNDLESFKQSAGWAKSGWDTYQYDTLLGAALRSGLPIIAADPDRADIMSAARNGWAGIPAALQARLGLDRPLEPELAVALEDEIRTAHCGAMPEAALGPMAVAQRFRDAQLADATLGALGEYGSAILFTGNNHGRKDRGVPWYIRARAPDVDVIFVAFVDVETGRDTADAYVARGPDGAPTADFIVFTPRAERGDPCAAFGRGQRAAPG
ncbi:MAG: ChaN family lipoprotein [Hyphomicrobium sp.]|nr:ChaN family lipoprotein [Hyphomicrobium sp.]